MTLQSQNIPFLLSRLRRTISALSAFRHALYALNSSSHIFALFSPCAAAPAWGKEAGQKRAKRRTTSDRGCRNNLDAGTGRRAAVGGSGWGTTHTPTPFATLPRTPTPPRVASPPPSASPWRGSECGAARGDPRARNEARSERDEKNFKHCVLHIGRRLNALRRRRATMRAESAAHTVRARLSSPSPAGGRARTPACPHAKTSPVLRVVVVVFLGDAGAAELPQRRRALARVRVAGVLRDERE